MGMVDSGYFSGHNFINFALNCLDKGGVFDGWVDGYIFLCLDRIVNINANNSFGPLLKLGHFLAWELISIASDVHSAIIIDYKFCVFISPPINFKPLLFIPYWLWCF